MIDSVVLFFIPSGSYSLKMHFQSYKGTLLKIQNMHAHHTHCDVNVSSYDSVCGQLCSTLIRRLHTHSSESNSQYMENEIAQNVKTTSDLSRLEP